MNSPNLRVFAALSGVALSLAAYAADWPQWRGPGRNAMSSEAGLLKQWPKEGPNLLWQNRDIGDGYATPAVAGDRIYTLSNRGLDNEYVQALSVSDGKVLWTTTRGLGAADFMTGKSLWQTAQGESIGPVSVMYADGRLYLHGFDSDVALVEATPEAYRELGRFTPPERPQRPRGERESAWPHPVVANGRLYIRDIGTLWCYDISSE